jgi:hypothetical protein
VESSYMMGNLIEVGLIIWILEILKAKIIA